MPALAFGLKPVKNAIPSSKAPLKRKAVFDDNEEGTTKQDEDDDAFGALQKPRSSAKPRPVVSNTQVDRPRKSPKLSDEQDTSSSQGTVKYSNLSALRSAKLQDTEASKVDASVYDYDEVYDSFTADKKNKDNSSSTSTVPKYMTNLMASAEVRKRDQMRAKEKSLQKEREAEGDEFADKEKFVTGAYKQQQEETRRLEAEEKKREEEEEERRRKGGGMTTFHKDLLKKDEERQKAIEEAAKNAQSRKDADTEVRDRPEIEESDAKVAAELNEQGAHIVTNDEGEIVDRRQLLSAGLNVAPKKSVLDKSDNKIPVSRPQDYQRSTKQQDARTAQRERQTRMMEQQIEEITARQKDTEATEQKELEDKNKSKLTEGDKLSAKERYLQRKREKEEEATKSKAGAG